MKFLIVFSLLAIAFLGCATSATKPQAPIKASLQIAFDVDDHGHPQNVTVVSWTGPEADRKKIEDAAISSVKSWILNPALRGRHVVQPMEFHLEGDAPPSTPNLESSVSRRPAQDSG